jgi:hypothetical protein
MLRRECSFHVLHESPSRSLQETSRSWGAPILREGRGAHALVLQRKFRGQETAVPTLGT